jgi:hypothetical protein
MSRVTNVILTAHVGLQDGSDPEIEYVNKFLRETDCGYRKFVEVTEHAGGTKYMECRVYLSAFNHADTNAILRAIDQAPWRDKEMVQVFVKNRRKKSFGFGTPVVEASDDECNRLLTTVVLWTVPKEGRIALVGTLR